MTVGMTDRMLPSSLQVFDIGWGARIRTWEWRNQNPLPYHLATPHETGAQAHLSQAGRTIIEPPADCNGYRGRQNRGGSKIRS